MSPISICKAEVSGAKAPKIKFGLLVLYLPVKWNGFDSTLISSQP